MIGVAGVIAVFMLVSLAQEMNRRLQIRREVVRLEQEVHDLENSLVAMANLNQYFRTDAFRERMAREKLNYRAEGEKVVLINEDDRVAGVTDDKAIVDGPVSVPRRWWEVFFGEQVIY